MQYDYGITWEPVEKLADVPDIRLNQTFPLTSEYNTLIRKYVLEPITKRWKNSNLEIFGPVGSLS